MSKKRLYFVNVPPDVTHEDLIKEFRVKLQKVVDSYKANHPKLTSRECAEAVEPILTRVGYEYRYRHLILQNCIILNPTLIREV